MLIYDILHKEKVYHIVTNDLRNFGVKYRLKKNILKTVKVERSKGIPKKVFETSLSYQPLDVVNLSSGGIVHVPVFVSQAATFLERHITQEGLFRKAGSRARQKELMTGLDCGYPLGEQHHAIDVANCLKTFFRSLPEPLIPYSYHELFVHCGLLKARRTEAILLSCLLLPPHHLNTLAFLMEFLKRVSLHEKQNKMNSDNLAKVIGPNIMPLRETTISAIQTRLELHLFIVKILIENAENIGVLPDNISQHLSVETIGSTDNELDLSDSQVHLKMKKKKHRSGSLTRKPHLSASNLNLRVFNGLKKIVGKGGSSDDFHLIDNQHVALDINLMHTVSGKISKKRKVPEKIELSSTKKKRLTDKLEKSKKMRLSLDRFVSKKHKPLEKDLESNSFGICPERRWSSVNESCKKSKSRYSDGPSDIQAPLKTTKPSNSDLQDHYEDVFIDADVNLSDDSSEQGSRESGKQMKRQREKFAQLTLGQKSHVKNLKISLIKDETESTDVRSEEYVRIPKSEYEEIKNRVSAIETRISQEFGCMTNERTDNLTVHSANQVQTEYERTLEENCIENTISADHLARRLGKELKIRRSAEHKIIRSPSARKIGSLKRRSQEKIASKRVTRSASWHVSQECDTKRQGEDDQQLKNFFNKQGSTSADAERQRICPRMAYESFCSEETNARLDFLQKQLTALISHTTEHTGDSISDDESCFNVDVAKSKESKAARRASSFHGNEFTGSSMYFNRKVKQLQKINGEENALAYGKSSVKRCTPSERNTESVVSWKDADNYFKSTSRTNTPVPQTGRASIAKLRSQNAGMVLAKAKLFDENNAKASNMQIAELHGEMTCRQTNKSPKHKNLKLSVNSPLHSSSNMKTFTKGKVKPNEEYYDENNVLKTNSLKVYQTCSEAELFEKKENISKNDSPVVKKLSVNTVLHDGSLNSSKYNVNPACKTPHIKRPLTVKTPKSAKSLVRRPAMDTRRTPLKAVARVGTPKHQSPKGILKMRTISRNAS